MVTASPTGYSGNIIEEAVRSLCQSLAQWRTQKGLEFVKHTHQLHFPLICKAYSENPFPLRHHSWVSKLIYSADLFSELVKLVCCRDSESLKVIVTNTLVLYFVVVVETGPCYVVPAGLKCVAILMPRPPKCQDYWHMPPHPAHFVLSNIKVLQKFPVKNFGIAFKIIKF